jgi:hypothetical protein
LECPFCEAPHSPPQNIGDSKPDPAFMDPLCKYPKLGTWRVDRRVFGKPGTSYIDQLLRAFQDQDCKISDSNQLFKALKKHPDMIPREAYPSSVFFLLTLESFTLSLKEWLVYALESKHYSVC